MSAERILELLDAAHSVVPFHYAQWVVEDPLTFEFRVVAAHLPADSEGYATAHRTGVIGQVFRTRRAIAVANTKAHPLYDPFDTSVDWELAVPMTDANTFAAVLNFEGIGTFPSLPPIWPTLQMLAERIGAAIDELPPDITRPGTVITRTVLSDEPLRDARTFADDGKSVLMIRNGAAGSVIDRTSLEDHLRGEAPRIDCLSLRIDAFERHFISSCVEGRYDVVIWETTLVA